MFAFVTLVTSDFYLPGALTLAAALKDVHSSSPSQDTFQTVCLTTPETVDVSSIKLLRRAFDVVIGVEIISQHDMHGLNLLGRPDLDTVLTKLHIFRLTQFEKVIYLDADVLPVRPLSHLFHLEHEFSAVPDVGWPDIFNSGVLVFSPGEEKFQQLNKLLKSGGSWDGGDQGILNEWRGDNWNRLSFTYNTTPTASYTYAPAYERFGSKISAIHFIGPNKPWKEIPYRTPGLHTASCPSGPPPTDAQPHQSYDYASLVDRWFEVYDHHYRPPSREPESEFRAPQYSAVWNEDSASHADMATTPSFGVQPLASTGTFGLGELKRVAIEGMLSSGVPPIDAHSGEGVYYSMPLEGRVDLMYRPPSAEAQEDATQLTPTQQDPYRDRLHHYFEPSGPSRPLDEPFVDHRWQRLQDEQQQDIAQVAPFAEALKTTPLYSTGQQPQRRAEPEYLQHEHHPRRSEHHLHPQRQHPGVTYQPRQVEVQRQTYPHHHRAETHLHPPFQQQPSSKDIQQQQPSRPSPFYQSSDPESFDQQPFERQPQHAESQHQHFVKRQHRRSEPLQQVGGYKQHFETQGEQPAQQQYRRQSLQELPSHPKHRGEENVRPAEQHQTPRPHRQGHVQHRVEARPRSEHYIRSPHPSSSPPRPFSFPAQRSSLATHRPASPPKKPVPPPRPSSPPLLLWNPAVEPPPTTPPSVSNFPTETYYENVWDLPYGMKFEEQHQYYDQGHLGPLPASRSEVFFEPPPPPQIPPELLRQGHYRNITGDTESPAPDPTKVKSVFPWEMDPQHKHVPKRVFPDSEKLVAPEPEPEPVPSPPIHVASPALGSPLQVKGSPLATPSPVQGVPTSLSYINAWDVVPSIQKYASRLAKPAKAAPALLSADEWRRSSSTWEDQSEGGSHDGDVEDEGEDSDQLSEPEPEDVSEETAEVKAWRRRHSVSKEKQYRVRGVQTMSRETREIGIQTTGIVKVIEPTRPVRLPVHAEAGVGTGATTPPPRGKTRSPPSGVQSPREYAYPQSPPPGKRPAIPFPKVSLPPPAIHRERSGETASPPSSVGPVSPPEGQPIGLPGTSSQPLPQIESPTESPISGSLSRKSGRVWDPARGVDIFKRNSEEVLAKFLRMGSFDDDTGRA